MTVQRCNCGGAACKSAKLGSETISGLGSRRSGARFRSSGSGTGSGSKFARDPHLYLKTRTRDLRAETWDLRMCMMAAGNIPVSGLPWGWGYGGRGVRPARPRMTGPVIPTRRGGAARCWRLAVGGGERQRGNYVVTRSRPYPRKTGQTRSACRTKSDPAARTRRRRVPA